MSNHLDYILKLANLATPLPWEKDICAIDPVMGGDSLAVTTSEHDAAYIVAACNSLPELIAENRELREQVRELERQRAWLAVFIEDNMDCDKCPYFLTVCTPEAPVDCAEWIKQAAKEAGE